jgi:hypothetical protein
MFNLIKTDEYHAKKKAKHLKLISNRSLLIIFVINTKLSI